MKEKPGSIHSGHRLRSWEVQVVAGGRLRLLEGRVGGRGDDGAVDGRARRRGRRGLRYVEGVCGRACKTRSGL